jgi:hypothetical protein
MLVKLLMPKYLHRRVIVDAEDVGEGPRGEGFDKGNVCVDAKMSAKSLILMFWWRQVVIVAEDIDKDMLLELMLEMSEKPL